MLIQGSLLSSKTQILIDNYVKLIDDGVSASQILVLTLNPNKRAFFTKEVVQKCKCKFIENPRIYTFLGLAYNAVNDNWVRVENNINMDGTVIFPNLIGLEISELFMKQAVRETGFNDYNSKVNLLHQLFRRHSLIVQNDLSALQIAQRSFILKESFGEDAKNALEIFKKKTLEYRAFDYLRQLSIFSFIYKKTDYFKDIKYIFVDDADEITNAEFEFLKHLKPQAEEFFIAYDKYGPSRMGFLNADIKMPQKLENLFGQNPKKLDDMGFHPIKAETSYYSNRLEMLNRALEKVQELLKNGVEPKEICIITPIIDSALKFCLNETLSKKQVHFISGSEKLVETPLVRDVLTIIKLSLPHSQTAAEQISLKELKGLLSGFLKIPIKYCLEIIQNYKNDGVINLKSVEALDSQRYNARAKLFNEMLGKVSDKNLSLYEKSVLVFESFFDKDFLPQLEKFNFFLKQLADFEKVFEKEKLNPKFQKMIVTQLENSIISENPPDSSHFEEDVLIVSTAQKIIDLGLKRKYQIWLDTSSVEWTKQDTGTLYNSWVFQSSWEEPEFTYEINLKLSEEKTKRQLRKLSLLAENICAFSSLFDINGLENDKGIAEFFASEKKSNVLNFSFTPREDQKPVLSYNSGKMAISAVPGAGKTTILLALVIKLIHNKINPERIFVLTYMDSAARNFKQRIKKICPNIASMPNISTIHGLALKILKENSNFIKIGLETDFEVCDENERQKIIRELLARGGYEQDDFEKYEKAISALKLSCAKNLKRPSTDEAKKFMRLYEAYNLSLRSKNTVDYDDMLLYSVKLLEENPEIQTYYSELCEFLIEDEAQDSSVIQQRLLSLLSQKHNNLIRCGDINQSITSTFTNADMDGFKKFIEESQSVEMNSSQRCNKEIFSLANDLVDFSKKQKEFNNAFFDLKMKEVENKNPQNKNSLSIKTFEDFNEERSFIIEEIKKIFTKKNDASVAFLVRNNFQIAQYEEFLSNYGFTIITRSDCLERQPVFNLIFALLKFCEHPWDNENVIKVMKNLLSQKIINFSSEDIELVRNLKEPFVLRKTDSLLESEDGQKLLPGLLQLSWDLNYWLDNSNLSIEELTLKIGNYYFSSEIEKSNVHLISGLFKRISSQYKNDRNYLLERIEEISKRPAQYKFFAKEEDEKEAIGGEEQKSAGYIQIMTYHKSKGDEFDFVFLPELTEELLSVDFEGIKIKANLRFIEHIKSLNPQYKTKDETALKLAQIEENLRLFYVAVTRAKCGLIITCAKKYKKFSRLRDFKPSKLFETFLLAEKGVQVEK